MPGILKQWMSQFCCVRQVVMLKQTDQCLDSTTHRDSVYTFLENQPANVSQRAVCIFTTTYLAGI